MKQYTDSERKVFMVNKAVIKERHGNYRVIEVLWPTPSCQNSRVVKELTGWHQTLDEAIDDAMNRQAERTANEARRYKRIRQARQYEDLSAKLTRLADRVKGAT